MKHSTSTAQSVDDLRIYIIRPLFLTLTHFDTPLYSTLRQNQPPRGKLILVISFRGQFSLLGISTSTTRSFLGSKLIK